MRGYLKGDWKITLENRHYTDSMYAILAKRISKDDCGKFKNFIYLYFAIGFSCNAFIRKTRDWEKAYDRLLKEGREKDFLGVLNSIEIDLDAVDMSMLHKPTLNKMKKDELINYAKKEGVIVKSNNTKAQIVEKL